MNPYSVATLCTELENRHIMPDKRRHNDIIQRFFPETHALIKSNELHSYSTKLDRIWLLKEDGTALFDGDQIGFCSLCQMLKELERSSYLSHFINGDKKGPSLNLVFWNLLIRNGKALLDEMEEKASSVLNNVSISQETQNVLRQKLEEWLKGMYPLTDKDYSYLYVKPKKDVATTSLEDLSQNFPLSDAVYDQLDYSLARALSRYIASAAIWALRKNMQKQALNIIWPSKNGENEGWRDLVRQGDDHLSNNKPQDAMRLYEQAESIAKLMPNFESIPLYQHLTIQHIKARLMTAITEDNFKDERKKLEKLCKQQNSRYRGNALLMRGHLKERGLGYEQNIEAAFTDYAEAANCNEAPYEALITVGHAFEKGEYGCSPDPIKAYSYFKRGSDRDNAQCAYYLAKLCEEHYEVLRLNLGITDAFIQSCYDKAATGGIVAADKRLRNMQFRSEVIPSYSEGDVLPGDICLVNTEQGKYVKTFISDPNDFEAVVYGDICSHLANNPDILRHKGVVFAFLSDNHTVNVSDAVNLIRYMNDYSETYAERADWKRCELFILSKDESAAYIIDSAMSNLIDDIYLKVNLLDPDEYAVERLLLEQPTLIPCLPTGSTHTVHPDYPRCLHDIPAQYDRNVTVIGTGHLAYRFIKQLIGCTYLSSYPTKLCIIGENAEALKNRIEEECHGIFSVHSEVGRIIPQFYTCDPRLLPIHRKTGNEKEQHIQDNLRQANYIVVCTEDDEQNLNISLNLRSGLLAYRSSPVSMPYITLRYRNPTHAWLATRLTVNQQTKYKGSWTDEFALNVFGSDEAFSYSNIRSFALNSFAIRLHKSYYGLKDNANEHDVHSAMKDYYKSSYNRSSSRAQALAIVYELFAMGVFFEDRKDYAAFSAYAELSEAVHYYLTAGKTGEGYNESRVEQASEVEHERWNGYMLTNGWRTASPAEYHQYIDAGNGRHHLEIAKLHPYIVACHRLQSIWQDLEATLSSVPWKLKQHLPEPNASDIAFVKILHELITCENQSVFDLAR